MEIASQVHGNHETVDSSSQKQNVTVEKHELASGQLNETVEPRIRDSLAQNCRAIDCSIQEQNTSMEKHELASRHLGEPIKPMIIGSLTQNCQIAICSSQKENISAKEHESASAYLSEPVEPMTIDSLAHNCRPIDCSCKKQDTFVEEHQLASEPLRESVGLVINCSLSQNQTIDCSIHEQNTSVKKPELASRHLIEPVEPTSVEKHELVFGHLSESVEPMCIGSQNAQIIDISSQKQTTFEEKHELAPVSSNQPMETMTTSSLSQNCQTIGSSYPEQSTPYEKPDVESKHESGESINIVHVASTEVCHINGNSFSKEDAFRGKAELDSDFVPGEHKEASIVVSMKSCHSESIENMMLGFDTGSVTIVSGEQKCQTSESAALEQNPPNDKYGSEQNELGNTKIERPDVVDKCSITGNPISNEDALEGKPELDLKHVLSGLSTTSTAGNNTQKYLTMDSCHNEPCSEHLLGEQSETRIVGSDSIDVAHSNLETMIIDSAAQNSQIIGTSILGQNASEKKHKMGFEHESSEPMDSRIMGSGTQARNSILEMCTLDGKRELDSKLVQEEPVGSNPHNIQSMEPCSEPVNGEETETRIVGSASVVDVGQSGIPSMCTEDKTNESSNKESTGPSSRKRKSARSVTPGPARVLRPRSNGLVKPREPSVTSVDVSVQKEEEQKREGKRKKRKWTKNASENEFSKTRKHLRYLLTRIRYQHNFIDAYSGEGWKGQSVEKIKPEKELQRATSEILRFKRRIRELFEQMDSSCAEGRFQESLFDSEGQISSEDIFCAKCGSTDLSADNDIILCDGVCDRGFHQKCLEPPLLKEDIPPGDESWLCPGCDCKADCIELLNESQGTNLSVDDVWEKVFPEAADSATGDMIDEIAGLPSDDSEDYEYNPDASEVEEGVQSKGANSEDSENSQYSGNSEDTENSDDSDFSSASDDLGVLPIEDPYLGLPSDDSEDDEYDPNAPDVEHSKEESSSSDFSSASEDFSVSSDANAPSGTDDNPMVTSVDGSKPPSSNKRFKIPRNTKESVNSELQTLIEPSSQDDPLPISGKRQRERLDYKKLHDEAYGNGPSDSSEDDEEWVEADSPPRKKDDGVGEESSLSPKANSPTSTSRRNTKGSRKRGPNGSGDISKRRKCIKKDNEGANNLEETTRDSPEPNLTDKKATASANKTLGEAVTQRLYESFKENEYPSRNAKESLANELGLSFQQVTKWFGNARWSSRHSPNSAITRTKRVSPTKDQTSKELVEQGADMVPKDNSNNLEMSKPENPNSPRKGTDISAELDHKTPDKASSSDRENVVANISADLNHKTPEKASSNDREVVISIPASSSEFDRSQKKKGGKINQGATRSNTRSQTRRKNAVTPKDK